MHRMTRLLVRLFRSVFATAVLILFLVAALAGYGAYTQAGGNAVTGIVVLFAGLILVIAFCGAIALQIENNDLLRRIAEAVERGALAGEGAVGRAGTPAARMRQGAGPVEPMVTRTEPVAMRADGPAAQVPPSSGRVEPVLRR
jgi:hypothetical protein